MRTRSQNYAQAIHLQVRTADRLGSKERDRYGALCHRFPILVLRSGLAQAVGFLDAKADRDYAHSAHGLLLAHLSVQLLGNQGTPAALLAEVHRADLGKYRLLTRKALGAAVWYKRYAESLLGIDSSASVDSEGGPE